MALNPGTSALTPTLATPPRMPARVATVRRQFDQRARRFGQHDALAREVGRRLVDRLQYIRLSPRRVLDIGCGAGGALGLLSTRYPSAEVLGLDLSEGMLRQRATRVRDRLPRWLGGQPALLVAADAGSLPMADASVDLAFSNLMLHWHPEPHTLFPEWKRVLRVDGLLLFSCFGPDTLKELRAACRSAMPAIRPVPFIDMHDFGDMMVASGLADPVMDAEVITLTYRSARDLLAEVRALGGNPRDDRAAGLPSARQARSLLDALDARAGEDGRIRLTFEVAYGHAWKPAPRPEARTVSVEALRADLARRRQPSR
ncbi:MAG: methyltransferase domain-containing protein [Betaproteobacteria bacterium]